MSKSISWVVLAIWMAGAVLWFYAPAYSDRGLFMHKVLAGAYTVNAVWWFILIRYWNKF